MKTVDTKNSGIATIMLLVDTIPEQNLKNSIKILAIMKKVLLRTEYFT